MGICTHKNTTRDCIQKNEGLVDELQWTRMDVVPVEYGTFAQTFQLAMWFFQFITGITFKWDYVIVRSVAMLVWIGLWNKLRI